MYIDGRQELDDDDNNSSGNSPTPSVKYALAPSVDELDG
jgi:hypothetical protein